MNLPILYSFRRCPYAMRARMGLAYASIQCEIREIDFKNKPQCMLKASPKGTVPVLILADGTILEQSLDILNWSLAQSDPEGWNDLTPEQEDHMEELIAYNDGAFKKALDHYKYPERYLDESQRNANDFSLENRVKIEIYLHNLEKRIQENSYLIKKSFSKADVAIFPFIRQFAEVEREWFDMLPLVNLQKWLQQIIDSSLFKEAMHKYEIWKEGDYAAFPAIKRDKFKESVSGT